jgi:hypothetical protein
MRGELLYRGRVGREPPNLSPTVLLLDVSPACQVASVAATLRPAAYVLAKALLHARVPSFVVPLGRRFTARALQHPADLFELLAARSTEPVDAAAALLEAESLRKTLPADGRSPPPRIVLFTQTFFGAEEPPGPVHPHVRALFAEYPDVASAPPLRHRCERWAVVPSRGTRDVLSTVAELLS